MRSDERPARSVPGMVPAGRTKNATGQAAAAVVCAPTLAVCTHGRVPEVARALRRA